VLIALLILHKTYIEYVLAKKCRMENQVFIHHVMTALTHLGLWITVIRLH